MPRTILPLVTVCTARGISGQLIASVKIIKLDVVGVMHAVNIDLIHGLQPLPAVAYVCVLLIRYVVLVIIEVSLIVRPDFVLAGPF